MEWSDSSSINMSNVVRQCGTLSSRYFSMHIWMNITKVSNTRYWMVVTLVIYSWWHYVMLTTFLCHANNLITLCPTRRWSQNQQCLSSVCWWIWHFFHPKKTLCVIKGTNIFRKALTCILAGEVQMGRLKRHMCYLITLHLRNDCDIQLKKGNYVSSENRFWVLSLKIYLKAMMFPQNYFKDIALHFMAVSCGIQLIFHWYIIAWNKAVRRIFHFPHITHRCLLLCVVNSSLICVTVS